MRPNLLIAGIFNIIAGILWIMLGSGNSGNNVILALGAFAVVSGVIFIMYSKMKIEEVVEKRNTILTISIFLYPVNFVSAIITSIEYDLIKRDYAKYKKLNNITYDSISTSNNNPNKQVSKEVKRLDILLKIGVVMVAIAGVMIVTTSWEAITDVIKFVLLVIIAFLFLGLSKFSEIKLKIRNTTIAYWLLSMISLGLSIFLIGYGKLLGDWFCIDGEGEQIFIASLSVVIALLSYITYRKFNLNGFLYVTFVALTCAVLCVLDYLKLDLKTCVLILASALLVINAIPRVDKKAIKIIKNFSTIATYILTLFILLELVNIKEDTIICVTLVVQAISLILLGIIEKSEATKVLSSLCIMLLVSSATYYLSEEMDEIIRLIITRGIFVLLAVLISVIVIRDNKLNNLFLGIALPLVLLSIINKVNIAVALFVGCISLIMIIFGAIKKEYKALYIEGIVFTIINLVVQLWDLWGELPFYIYLLIGGFVLIGIVTIKELRKSNKDEIKENDEYKEAKFEQNTRVVEKVEVVSNQAINENAKEVTESENKDEQI